VAVGTLRARSSTPVMTPPFEGFASPFPIWTGFNPTTGVAAGYDSGFGRVGESTQTTRASSSPSTS
jgi:hypothetical protein